MNTGQLSLVHLAGVKRLADTGSASENAIQNLMRQTRSGAEQIVVSADPARATPIVMV